MSMMTKVSWKTTTRTTFGKEKLTSIVKVEPSEEIDQIHLRLELADQRRSVWTLIYFLPGK